MSKRAQTKRAGGVVVALALVAGFGAGVWRFGFVDLWPEAPAEAPIGRASPVAPVSGASTPPPGSRIDPGVVFGALTSFPSSYGALAPFAPGPRGMAFHPREPEALAEETGITAALPEATTSLARALPPPPLPPRSPFRVEPDAPLSPLLAPPLPPLRPREVAALPTVSDAPPLAPTTPLAPDARPPLPAQGPFAKGSQAFVRIFKQEGQLELWLKREGRYALYKSFPICKWSGKLGPKVKEGDYQSPEGFYSVTTRQLNPNSAYHLAFNVGFPNAYDRQHGRTGSALMVHGDCVSVGCFAMTNKGIEEIYSWIEAALRGGQREVPVHIFPFRMTRTAIAREAGGTLFASLFHAAPQTGLRGFWDNLKEGYDLFEKTGEPPEAYACNKRYMFNGAGAGCRRIAGW